MKYTALVFALLSLNCCAGTIFIENRSGHTVTISYTHHDGHSAVLNLQDKERKEVTIVPGYKDCPQIFVCQWEGLGVKKERVIKDPNCCGFIIKPTAEWC